MIDVENEGKGAPPLVVPGLVWPDPNRHLHGWRPSEGAPIPIDPREAARQRHAESLRDEALANVDPALVEAASAALAASTAAADALRMLVAEKHDLGSAISESAALASLTIDRRIDAARLLVEQANARSDAALQVVRDQLVVYFNQHIVLRERARASELDDRALLLQEQAGDMRIVPITVRGWLENYLPPVQAQPAALPARKRLFG